MAEYTIKDSLSSVAEYIGEAVATKENAFRVSTMPAASADYAGEIYQYVGATDASYTNGYYYECAEDNGVYGWQQINVQPSNESGQTIQYDEMSEASVDNLNQIIQYTGATTQDYTNGYFYKCVAQGTDPETYAWETQSVQEGSADSRIGEEITDIKVEKDNGVNRPYINVNPSKVYSKLGEWDDMTDFLQAPTHTAPTGSSTYTASEDEKVLAVCYVSDNEWNVSTPTINITTTGEELKSPYIFKQVDSTETNPAYGGIGIGQVSLASGETVSITSSGTTSVTHNMHYYLPMDSALNMELVTSGSFAKNPTTHSTFTHTIDSNGHYVLILACGNWYGTPQVTSIGTTLNGANIENQFSSLTDPCFNISEFIGKAGDELLLDINVTANFLTGYYLIKLTESDTQAQENKIELARKDEIGGGSTIPKLTSSDIEEIKSQWNPPGGGGGGGSSTHEYSTDEQVVGKWVDGSDLYEKTIHITTSVTSGATIATIDSLNEICFAQGTFKTSNGFTRIIGYNDGAQYMTVYADANAIKVIFTGVFASGQPITSIKLLVQYTKTSS